MEGEEENGADRCKQIPILFFAINMGAMRKEFHFQELFLTEEHLLTFILKLLALLFYIPRIRFLIYFLDKQ